ncbi:MAG: BolA/IbaG family iron-sulfur metabolism protein [Gammaproteobacteria bacterium]|nr:BolA/IbaG family iron-sulfur metabolism protein [Gammaproteobacteria bacterium]
MDDESAHHHGHAGAASGGGHYTVTIVSERFRDRAMIARSSIMATARRL